jgi:hypothetical protein
MPAPAIRGIGVLAMISIMGDEVKGEERLLLAKTIARNVWAPSLESSIAPVYLLP